MRTPEIAFACPSCGREAVSGLDGHGACPHCGATRALDPPAPRFVARTPQPAVTASTSPSAATPSDLETAPTPVVAAETSVRSTVFWRVSV